MWMVRAICPMLSDYLRKISSHKPSLRSDVLMRLGKSEPGSCQWEVRHVNGTYIFFTDFTDSGSHSILVHKKSLWDYLFHACNMLTDICNCHCDTYVEPWAKYSCFMGWCTVTLIGFRSCLTTTELRNIHTWALYCNVTVWQQSLLK